MADFHDAALVIAAHGSSVNEDSRQPALEHAGRIRALGQFAEVHAAFWKEEPRFKDILGRVRAERVYIVPLFVSEGYYTREVLPREFALEGRVTRRGGKEVYYCDPVGAHPYMTEALLKAAQAAVAGTPVDPEAACLFIVGHGTPKNADSSAIIRGQARRIADARLYAECHALFLEEPPFVRDWAEHTAQPNVIVVPFLIADGQHGAEDIPVLLGLADGAGSGDFANPARPPRCEAHARLRGRRLWYARAVGSEPRLAEVIIAQARAFHENDPAHFLA